MKKFRLPRKEKKRIKSLKGILGYKMHCAFLFSTQSFNDFSKVLKDFALTTAASERSLKVLSKKIEL